MKKYLIVLILGAGLTLFSCSSDSSFTEEEKKQQDSIDKVKQDDQFEKLEKSGNDTGPANNYHKEPEPKGPATTLQQNPAKAPGVDNPPYVPPSAPPPPGSEPPMPQPQSPRR